MRRRRGDHLRADIAAHGFAHARVTGTSMLPTLRPGEVVRLEACDEPRPGQVIAFEHGGGLLVHRVLRTSPGCVVCRGDNRIAEDGAAPLAAVVGKAVAVFGAERPGGVVLRDDRRALLAVEARIRARRRRAQLRHAGAELALLLRQVVAGGGLPPSCVAELSGLGEPHAAAGGRCTVTVPAGLYATLAEPERVALVRACLCDQPPAATLTVRALARDRRHLLASVGAAVRRALRRMGVDAGAPGDATWPSADGRHYVPVHLFAPDEFVAELERAGGRVVEVRRAMEVLTPVWQARVRPRRRRCATLRSSSGTR